jgi:hypothetical protein
MRRRDLMRLIANIAFLALLIIPCIAVPDCVTTGPYNISFDIGLTRDDYTVTIKDPIQKREMLTETIVIDYSVQIQNKTDSAHLAVIEINRREGGLFSPNIKPTSAQLERIVTGAINNFPGTSNVVPIVGPIDGTQGGIASFDLQAVSGYPQECYMMIYFPPSDKEHAQATVTTSYPLNRTLLLFSTLHIEYIGSSMTRTGKAVGGLETLDHIEFYAAVIRDPFVEGSLVLYDAGNFVLGPISGNLTFEVYTDESYQNKIYERSFLVPATGWEIENDLPSWKMPLIAIADIDLPSDLIHEYPLKATFKPDDSSEEFTYFGLLLT